MFLCIFISFIKHVKTTYLLFFIFDSFDHSSTMGREFFSPFLSSISINSNNTSFSSYSTLFFIFLFLVIPLYSIFLSSSALKLKAPIHTIFARFMNLPFAYLNTYNLHVYHKESACT